MSIIYYDQTVSGTEAICLHRPGCELTFLLTSCMFIINLQYEGGTDMNSSSDHQNSPASENGDRQPILFGKDKLQNFNRHNLPLHRFIQWLVTAELDRKCLFITEGILVIALAVCIYFYCIP